MPKPPPMPNGPMVSEVTGIDGETVDITKRFDEAKQAHAIVHAELRAGRVGADPNDPYVFGCRVHPLNKRSKEQNESLAQAFLLAYSRGEVAFGVGGLGSCWCDFEVAPGDVERIGLDTDMAPGPPGRKGVWVFDLLGDPLA